MIDFESVRRTMVECQLRPNKVIDPRLLAAVAEIPREKFVPKALHSIAYVDEDLHLGDGRHLMEPMVFARLLQAASIDADDVVLDVGCGTGYSTAVLAKLASSVVAVEERPELAKKAAETLAALDIDNAAVLEGPAAAGRATQGPYDVIAIEGSVEQVPAALTDQLADGGRLVCVRRETGVPSGLSGLPGGGLGRAELHVRTGGAVTATVLFDAQVPPLPGFEAPRGFVF